MINKNIQEKALDLVRDERFKQDEKWGNQHQNSMTWMAILGEEFGEACEAALHDKFGGNHKGTFKKEIIQIAAVCVQILEHIEDGTLVDGEIVNGSETYGEGAK